MKVRIIEVHGTEEEIQTFLRNYQGDDNVIPIVQPAKKKRLPEGKPDMEIWEVDPVQLERWAKSYRGKRLQFQLKSESHPCFVSGWQQTKDPARIEFVCEHNGRHGRYLPLFVLRNKQEEAKG